MINKISILYIQLLIIILETASNLLQPEYSIKILNTENTVLSLGDVDNDDDLEIIKNPSEESKVEEKLNKFHKYVNFVEMTERPKEKFYFSSYDLRQSRPIFEMFYPDSPHSIAVDEKHLSELERRSKPREKKKRRRRRRKKKWRRGEFEEVVNENKQMTPTIPSNVEEDIPEYNYVEKEYLDDVAEKFNNDIAFKYSDEGKPEETVKDVVYKIIDVKTPKNCTNFTGIGIQAVECIVKNFEDGELSTEQLFYGISIILLVWFCIYLLIALPLWCSKGWCCCCCRCAFCFPNNRVTDIQKYIALNPPGLYTDSNGVRKEYVPTPKEIEIYERLRRLIADF